MSVNSFEDYPNLHFTSNYDVSRVCGIRTVEGSKEFIPFQNNHSKSRFGEVHRGEHDLH